MLLTLRWRMLSRAAVRSRAIQLATLIDHRLRLAGLGRKTGTTLRRWSRESVLQPVNKHLTRVAEIADRAAYSGEYDCLFDTEELERLARSLTYRQLKRLVKESKTAGDKTQAV